MSGDPYKMLTCPFNISHQIEAYRMQVHLQKCKKQNKSAFKVHCPFDATHIVDSTEIDHHVNSCQHREMLDNKLYDFHDNSLVPVNVVVSSSVQSVESWDDEVASSYQPKPKGPHIITKIKGATRSERRKARMENIKNYKPPPQ